MRWKRFSMWMRGVLLTGVAGLIAAGCLTTTNKDRPFSEDWARGQRKRLEFKRRQERIDGGELVFLGQKDKAHAGVKVDKEGRPELGLGKDNGLGVDMGGGGDKHVKFRYNWGWK